MSYRDPFDDRMTRELERLVEDADASESVRTRIERGLGRRHLPHGLIVWGSVAAAIVAVVAVAVGSSESGQKQKLNPADPAITSTTTVDGEVTPIAGEPGADS